MEACKRESIQRIQLLEDLNEDDALVESKEEEWLKQEEECKEETNEEDEDDSKGFNSHFIEKYHNKIEQRLNQKV